jgi:hypothetical protein
VVVVVSIVVKVVALCARGHDEYLAPMVVGDKVATQRPVDGNISTNDGWLCNKITCYFLRINLSW